MITLETLAQWLAAPTETECLEFKEAKQQFDNGKLIDYCVALGNEGGGHLVLGVSNTHPRRVVGTQAFKTETHLNEIKLQVTSRLGIRLEVVDLMHSDGRVLVFSIPSRPIGQPLHVNGQYWMRAGESLVGMTPDQLRRILSEGQQDWLEQSAISDARAEDVIALLDTQAFFDLLNLPYPNQREGVLERLEGEKLIVRSGAAWNIPNAAALLLAKRLESFPLEIARKAPRIAIYAGSSKLSTRDEITWEAGYAVGFEAMVLHVHSLAPQNRFIEQAIRHEAKMFPIQALRELIANALVHQDFTVRGTSVVIEMYADRIEIANPGTPPIDTDRFIDENQSRNERFAYVMRKLGVCEERGTGIDKVLEAIELFQLPPLKVTKGSISTRVVLYSHREFSEMPRSERVRACYQHCVLQYITGHRMSNQSLRERFGLSESATSTVSQVISASKDAGKVKSDDSESTSTRYVRYVPYWA